MQPDGTIYLDGCPHIHVERLPVLNTTTTRVFCHDCRKWLE
mgnify:CR=1 FL=1